MGKTNIEYADEVSNPLKAIRTGGNADTDKGTFCEKPDAEGTCKNCWAEVLNGRFGNKLKFDKANRDKIEWIYRETEMVRLFKLNRKKPMSTKFPGLPLVVFCCDTFDIFQPSISDELRDSVFNVYDHFTNLILLVQTTYPARMNHYFKARYGEKGLPKHYWIGMSAGDQKWLEKNITYLLQVKSSIHYLILEPLLNTVNLRNIRLSDGGELDALKGIDRKFQCHYSSKVDLVIVGGESGAGARPCHVSNIRSVVQQCKAAGVKVLVKQMGSNFIQINGLRQKLKSGKGGDISEFPVDLRVREYPRIAARGIEVIQNPTITQVEKFFTV
ncbi:MAG: phage Gp37/Gp68 family protein [Acidobacteriota bacterium]|nr:phage Gp37/Gp68 family protein [Acidobacteriota bacterium]